MVNFIQIRKFKKIFFIAIFKNFIYFSADDLVVSPKSELCMLIVDTQPTLQIRPVHCNLTNYFICMVDLTRREAAIMGRSFSTQMEPPPVLIVTPADREYDCQKGDQICKQLQFRETSCIRENSLYAVGGLLCRKMDGNQNCLVKKTLLAVNMNGGKHTATNGITYLADQDVPYEDPDQIRKIYQSPQVTGVDKDDEDLYKSQAFTHVQDYDPVTSGEKCVTYKVHVTMDGDYELAIRTVEPWHANKGKRVGKIDHVILINFNLINFN